MTDRTARVHLVAVTDAYRREMQKAADATDKLIARAGGLEAIGGKMQAVGGTLTRSVTMPLALAGGAAVKFSTDFETAFASIVGLAGVPQEEVEGLKQSVLDLAGETGRAPQELADALYFAASAGLDAAGAMDAVRASARGAAAGLGGTTDIVGLVASATASYGEEAINAAEAVDILTATIEEGRADPDELASTLGRVLPIASQLGVEFEEVGGTVAYLSNVFGDTNRTVTATQGLLVKLLSPSEQGRKALEQMGTSVEELHAAIDQDGLLGALDLLRERGFGENQQALAKLFDDIEGRQAAIALLADKSGSLATTLGAVADNAGSTDSALATMAETAGFKNQQAFAQLQTALIEVGDVLVPLVADVAEFAAKFLEAFNSLPGPAQTAVIALGGVLAAVGPLTSIGGKLVSNWTTIGRGFDKAAVGAYDLAGGMGKIARAGAVVGILYGVGQALDATVNRLERADLSGLQRALLDLTDAGSVSGEAASAFGDDFGKLSDAIERVGDPAVITQVDHALNTVASLGGLLGRGKEDLDQARATIDDLDAALAGLASTDAEAAAAALAAVRDALSPEDFDTLLPLLDDYQGALDGIDVAARTGAGSAEDLGGATEDLIPPVEEAVDAQEELKEAIDAVTSAMRAQIDPFWAAQDALLNHRDAQDKVKETSHDLMVAEDELRQAIRENGRESDQAAAAWEKTIDLRADLEKADRDVVRSAMDVSVATFELKRMMEETGLSIEGAEAQLRHWVDQGLITEEQAWQTAEELRGTTGAAKELGEQSPHVPVSADTSDADIKLDHLDARVAQITRDRTLRIFVNPIIPGDGSFSGDWKDYVVAERRIGGPIPGSPGQAVPILAHGGEFVLSADVVDAIKNGRPTAGLGASYGSSSSSVSNDNRQAVVNVHYPAPERVTEALPRLLRRAQYAV